MSADELNQELYLFSRKNSKIRVPFLGTDDFDRAFNPDHKGRYLVAKCLGKIVAVFKFYLWPRTKQDINEFLQRENLHLITGTVYQGAYIGVDPRFHRLGLGSKLNAAILGMMSPGDVFILGTHEPDGEALMRDWLPKQPINLLFGERLSAYAGYDPTRVNFVVRDFTL